jgi:hypothetical protein
MPHRLYVDEVGNDDMSHADDERHRYLSLSGVAMDQDYARDRATPALNALKAILKHDPDQQVILHRKDIMNKRGVFKCLGDAAICEAFDAGMVKFFTEIEYALITVVIDKQRMLQQQHWLERHPYHYLMKILVEKYVQWLERKKSTGDIMPEMRRGKKDAALQRAFSSVRIMGSDYVNAKRIKDAIPSKNLKFRAKEDNITGLQVCDLIAHPSHMDVRQAQGQQITLGPFAQKIVPVLRDKKYDRSPWSGNIVGYGIKYLP